VDNDGAVGLLRAQEVNHIPAGARVEGFPIANSTGTQIVIKANEDGGWQVILQPIDHIGSIVEKHGVIVGKRFRESIAHDIAPVLIIFEDSNIRAHEIISF
jgi:hypothetical protein